MYDRIRQKHNAKCSIGNARGWLLHYKNCITGNTQYADGFKGSFKTSILNTIYYLNKLL